MKNHINKNINSKGDKAIKVSIIQFPPFTFSIFADSEVFSVGFIETVCFKKFFAEISQAVFADRLTYLLH